MGAAWLRSLQQRFFRRGKISGWKLPLCYCKKCIVNFISLKITFLPLHFEAMEVEMRLCSNYDLTRCACWKKRLSLPHKLLQHPLLFLWFFFSWSLLFILCLGFCHSDWRRITQMPKSFFLSQAITSPTSANPVISAYKVGKKHKHKNGQSLKNLSIQNVLELMSSKHFTICHSYMCKKQSKNPCWWIEMKESMTQMLFE